jgi:hypothetical protein
LTIDAPILLAISLIAAISLVIRLRQAENGAAGYWIVAAVVCAGISAAGLTLDWDRAPRVAMLIDVSPSVRGAHWMDATQLDDATRRWLADADVRRYTFAFPEDVQALLPDEAIEERPTRQTQLLIARWLAELSEQDQPDAILVLSDGRFDVDEALRGHGLPITLIADPNLESAFDAKIVGATSEGEAVEVEVDLPAGKTAFQPKLVWHDGTEVVLRDGRSVVRREFGAGVRWSVRLDPRDAWPENDSASGVTEASEMVRWWIGAGDCPSGFVRVEVDRLRELAERADVAVVALEGVEIDERSHAGPLRQFVESGGTLVLCSADAGEKSGPSRGASIESMSPLSWHPPEQERAWVILVDGSGSMSRATQASVTRMERAINAMKTAVLAIPGDEPVSLYRFSRSVELMGRWERAEAARESMLRGPEAWWLTAGGPTNLSSALLELTSEPLDRSTELLVITDGDATLDAFSEDDVGAWITRFRAANVGCSMLALGEPSASLGKLMNLLDVSARGSDAMPEEWASSAQKIVYERTRVEQERRAIVMHFEGRLSTVPSIEVRRWHRAWLREGATALARQVNGSEADDDAEGVMMAEWRVGLGRVVAMAMPEQESGVDWSDAAWAGVRLDTTREVEWLRDRVRVDAVEESSDASRGRPVSGLQLEWTDGRVRRSLVEVAPGRYEAMLEPEAEMRTDRVTGGVGSRVVTVAEGDRVLSRRALSEMPPKEFAAVGLDRAALERVARESGGSVRDWASGKIVFKRVNRSIRLDVWTGLLSILFASVGAIAIVGGQSRVV